MGPIQVKKCRNKLNHGKKKRLNRDYSSRSINKVCFWWRECVKNFIIECEIRNISNIILFEKGNHTKYEITISWSNYQVEIERSGI